MFNEKKIRFPVFAVCALLVVYFFHYNDLFTLKIGNASPFMFLALVVSVAMYYGETVGLFYGLATGLLIDTAASGSYCFNTVFFSFLGFFAGIIMAFMFNFNVRAASTLSVIASFLYFGLKWIIFCFIPDVEGKIYYLLQFSLPSAFYSSLFIIPLFYVERIFAERYKRKNNINNI